MSTCTYTVNESGVALMKINNPPMNALSAAVLKDIHDAVMKAQSDDSARVIVFTGEGKAFIAGADIKEINRIQNPATGTSFAEIGQNLFNLIENGDKPFIAAINGFALGGGMELALSCHMRIADESAQMGLPEIKLGIIPGYGGTQRAARVLGRGKAMELILTGNFISGTEAMECGLVNRAVPKGESVKEALELGKNIALKGRPAVKSAMRAISEGLKTDFISGLKIERDEFGKLCQTENMKEGVSAFLEKREPKGLDR